jgi:hypothetical protein
MYLELARREAEEARNARALSEAAEQFALRQMDEGLRDHFLRVAGRAELEAVAHTARARRFEVIAASGAIGRRPAGSSRRGAGREADRAMARANAELVRRMLAAALREHFGVAPEHLPERGREPTTAA